jgi:hypothetical protein
MDKTKVKSEIGTPCILIKFLSFTKSTKCIYNRHNSIVIYHYNMFRHYSAEVLKRSVTNSLKMAQ